MSSKKFVKTKGKKNNTTETKNNNSVNSRGKVWAVRIVIVLLCVAVAVTLIPSIFF